MIPSGLFTSTPEVSIFLHNENMFNNGLHHVCRGGQSINNGVLGRDIKNWHIIYDNGSIWVLDEADFNTNNYSSALQFIAPNVTTVSLAFDNNMSPVIGYQTSDYVSHIKFLNPITQSGYINMDIPDVSSCKVCVDDIRLFNNGDSDVLFFYTINNKLYYRQQRDRYDIEYYVGDTLQKINKVGMSLLNRVQVELL